MKPDTKISLIASCAVFFAPYVEAGPCAPVLVNLRIGNVTLPNNSTARGAEIWIGTPAQQFAVLPQW